MAPRPPFRLRAKPGTVATLIVLAAIIRVSGQTSYDLRFRIAPPHAYLVDTAALGVSDIMSTRAADNGGLMATLKAGIHEIVLAADGYLPRRFTVDVTGPGQIAELKLERIGTALRLAAIVETDPRPKSVAYTPDGKHLVVAPLSGSRIDIFDAGSGALIATPSPPEGWSRQQGFVELEFPPGRGELWVSQMYTDRLHVFSLVDFSYLRTVSCGGAFPKVMLAHPDGRVFVSNWLSETVSVLSADGSARVGRIATLGTPRGLALSKDSSELYVANFSNGTIEVYDAMTYKRARVLFDGTDGLPGSLAKGGAKRHLVVDPVRNRLYASDMGRGSVFAYDLSGAALLAEIVIAPDAKTNTIAVSPDGRWLYASTRGPNNAVDYERKGPAFGELIVIDTETLTIVERHWGGNQPTGLAVSPDGSTVVFTDFLDHRMEIYRRTD